MASRIPTSPTSASFAFSRSPTHAGGILPSSSFFRPARPADQPRYTPPASLASRNNVADHEQTDVQENEDSESDIADHEHPPPEGDAYPLSHLRHSLEHSAGQEEDGMHPSQFTNTARSKQSREPLLPISGGSKSPGANNTFARPIPSPLPSSTSVARGVRTSIDRMFNRLSMSHTRNNPSIDSTEQRPRHRQSASISKHANYLTAHSESHHHRSSQSNESVHSSRSSSPAPSFIPVPPTPNPYPLSHVPRFQDPSGPPLPATTPSEKPTLTKSQNHTKPLRNHQLRPSRNHFFLGGRLLTGGGSPWAFIFSVSVVTVLSALWGSTTAVFWWRHGQGAQAIVIVGAYMSAIVVSCMFATAFTDPGILPRDLDPNPPYPASSPSDGAPRVPMPRDLKVRNEVVRVKYCPTCMTYRPPRASHCKMCDNCVDGCDHHCQWVNNCIGRRNYTTFFSLLCAADLTCLLFIVTSALHLWLLTRSSQTPRNFHQAISTPRGIGSAVVFGLSVLVIWPVSALLGYHIRLLFLNVTTIEQIRNQAYMKSTLQDIQEGEKLAKPPNPFTYGRKWRNVLGILCRPRGMSWMDFNAQATEDKRQVNPGMEGYDGDRMR